MSESTILCHECGYFLPSPLHSKLCKGKENIEFKCVECSKRFSKYKYLKDHQKTHTNTYIQCTLCDKKLKTKRNLNMHINMVHEKSVELNTCLICGNSYKRKYDLTKHQKIHAEQLFYCKYCPKQFHYK